MQLISMISINISSILMWERTCVHHLYSTKVPRLAGSSSLAMYPRAKLINFWSGASPMCASIDWKKCISQVCNCHAMSSTNVFFSVWLSEKICLAILYYPIDKFLQLAARQTETKQNDCKLYTSVNSETPKNPQQASVNNVKWMKIHLRNIY